MTVQIAAAQAARELGERMIAVMIRSGVKLSPAEIASLRWWVLFAQPELRV